MNNYTKNKNRIREKAIEWQNGFQYHDYSCQELAEIGDYFYKNGKRYGLLKEFRENGIC